jgi:hypothetical protein
MKAFFAHPENDLLAFSASRIINQAPSAFSTAFVWHKLIPSMVQIGLSKIDFGSYVEL